MDTKKIFFLEDKLMRLPGLYAMWTTIFVANFIVLLSDSTQGPSRDFNVCVNAASVIYGSLASVNNIFGNKLPSTMLLIAGPIHQYLHWLLFAYFGGSAVLGSHAIGIMNWVTVFVVGIFSLDMIFKTWLLACRKNIYTDYVAEELREQRDQVNQEQEAHNS